MISDKLWMKRVSSLTLKDRKELESQMEKVEVSTEKNGMNTTPEAG